MATTTKVLVQNSLAAATATVEFTAASNEQAFIGKSIFTNTSTSDVQVTVFNLASGETATDGVGGNWCFKETVPAQKTITADELIGTIVSASGNISVLAGTADVILINIFGAAEAIS